MKRKMVSLLLAGTMILGLTACSSTSSTASKAAEVASSAAAAVESTVEEAVSEAEEAVEEAVSEAEEAVSEAADAVESAVEDVVSEAEEVVSEAEAAVSEAVEAAESAAEEVVSEAEEVVSAAEEVVSEAEAAVSEAADAVESAVEDVVSEAEEVVSEAEAAVSEAEAVASEAAEAVVSEAAEVAEDSDVAYIQDKGSLIVGITDFEPMDYKDESGNWIGFDADLAARVAEDLGVEVEFIEIDWDNKILELNNKSIDVVWNGMTLTDEVKSSMETTNAYLNNAQVVVLPADKAEDFADVDSLKELKFAVEAGSAGEAAAEENGFDYTAVTAQSDTLLEVKSGTSDASIIDLLMADAMIGEGTSYPDLTHTLELTTEEYGVGCRQGSDLAAYINAEFASLYADGTLAEIAEKYNVGAAVIAQ